jgi:hypothetical protein
MYRSPERATIAFCFTQFFPLSGWCSSRSTIWCWCWESKGCFFCFTTGFASKLLLWWVTSGMFGHSCSLHFRQEPFSIITSWQLKVKQEPSWEAKSSRSALLKISLISSDPRPRYSVCRNLSLDLALHQINYTSPQWSITSMLPRQRNQEGWTRKKRR